MSIASRQQQIKSDIALLSDQPPRGQKLFHSLAPEVRDFIVAFLRNEWGLSDKLIALRLGVSATTLRRYYPNLPAIKKARQQYIQDQIALAVKGHKPWPQIQELAARFDVVIGRIEKDLEEMYKGRHDDPEYAKVRQHVLGSRVAGRPWHQLTAEQLHDCFKVMREEEFLSDTAIAEKLGMDVKSAHRYIRDYQLPLVAAAKNNYVRREIAAAQAGQKPWPTIKALSKKLALSESGFEKLFARLYQATPEWPQLRQRLLAAKKVHAVGQVVLPLIAAVAARRARGA